MKSCYLGVLAITLACFCLTALAGADMIESKPSTVTTAVRANNAFALDLHELFRGAGREIVFSPCSIFQVLAMAQVGARGETADVLAKMMHFDHEDAKIHSGLSQALAGMIEDSKRSEYDLSITNAIWRQKKQGLRKRFASTVSKNYDAWIQASDFKHNPESSLALMDSWLTKTAGGHIDDFFTPGIFDNTTQVVLVNSIRMKISSEMITRAMERTLSLKVNKKSQKTKELVDADDADALSLILFLTTQADDEKGSGEEAAWKPLFTTRAKQISPVVNTIRTNLNLRPLLEDMKAKDVFAEGADFSGITAANDMQIANVVHGAWIRRSTNGDIEALAVTMIVFASPQQGEPVILASR